MHDFFISIYRFFKRRRVIFWLVFPAVLGILTWGALKISIEEDITKFFPEDERVEKLNRIFQQSSFAERIVVMVSVKDSAAVVSGDDLVEFSDSLVSVMDREFDRYHATVSGRLNDGKLLDVFHIIRNNLPVFLNDADYTTLDSITTPEVSRKVLRHQYEQLISPSGVALKKLIVSDPMGFSFLALRKLQQLQYDDNLELYDSYVITRDRRHLLFFIQAAYGSNETGKNIGFVNHLSRVASEFTEGNEQIMVSFFGAPVVAVGNSIQLRKDTVLTLSLLGVLLALFIVGFFRDWRMLALILVPALFGGLFSLFCIALFKGSVSVLALAAGSVILGIAVNYALHFLVHLRDLPDKEAVIRDLTRPMTVGSLTTVLAFFSLHFTNAAVLRDIGLFAGFSLIGAVLCSLIFLPHLSPKIKYSKSFVEKFSLFQKPSHPGWAIAILSVTPVFLFFASEVKFNSEMSGLNFMSEETRASQERLEGINPASLHTLYIASDGQTMEGALQKNDRIVPRIDSLVATGVIKKYHSPSAFLLSDSLQRIRIETWEKFWTPQRKKAFYAAVKEEGKKLRFAPAVMSNIDSLIEKQYAVLDTGSFNGLRRHFFENNVVSSENDATIVSLINVLPEDRPVVEASLRDTPATLLDRQIITALFVEYVNDDFNFIVGFTSVLVFIVLLIAAGRIEITVITFMPMLITWIWILGIMALVGIEFNIVNVMISTFIFGLGDDYSIFVMDGLLQEYRTGKPHLRAVRTSIFLSAVTTISGLGVLIFAEHPALRSIAAIAIIGIACVFIMSQTIEPYLFSMLVTRRVRKKRPPMTLKGMIVTTATYGLFVTGSVFLSITGLLLKIVPVRNTLKKLWYHQMIRFCTGAVMTIAFNLRKKFILENSSAFSRPGIIIANHSSFIDILLTAMLHPRIILLTNKWVWNSPIFGMVVRLADYYPVMDGAEESVCRLRDRLGEGYSVLVFPEGTRSEDGKIQRFHKGAFYMAEKLNVPIYPLLIHGAAQAVPKGTMYVNDGNVSLKMLPAIEPGDPSFGLTYSERTKKISRFFKEQFETFTAEEHTPASFRSQLYNNFRYKGPVLEWYLRVKLKLENNYESFHGLIPENASIIDLGCGYGFLCYMLQFLSAERTITGVDYDEEKIAVAHNGYLRSPALKFFHSDVRSFTLERYDVIILSDVLHYLRSADQFDLLLKCFHALNPGGKIILRDGDADLEQRHKATRLSEFFSVRLLKFNKSQNDLKYISGTALEKFAELHGYEMRRIDQGGRTSNVIFVLSGK